MVYRSDRGSSLTRHSSSPVTTHRDSNSPAEVDREEISKLPVAENHLCHGPSSEHLRTGSIVVLIALLFKGVVVVVVVVVVE